jgi:hypothetical protein
LEAQNAEFSMNYIECGSAIAAPLHRHVVCVDSAGALSSSISSEKGRKSAGIFLAEMGNHPNMGRGLAVRGPDSPEPDAAVALMNPYCGFEFLFPSQLSDASKTSM